jgi:hypothetical protein
MTADSCLLNCEYGPDRQPKIYVYELPARLNLDTVNLYPSQRLDFWYVEHLFHLNVLRSKCIVNDPDSADYFLIPFYPACYFAAFAYERGIDPGSWSRIQRYRSELHVHLGFRETMQIVRSKPSWNRMGGRRHMLIFGQGRGANSGYFWRCYQSQVRHCTFLGVEARPWGNPSSFRLGHDVVIPGYTPWHDVIEEVASEKLTRDIFIHFRGRSWGAVRTEVFRSLRPSHDIVLDQDARFALGGENRPASRNDAKAYFRELHRSVFCLCPAGWTPWSKRIYETILCGAIPVFIPGSFVPPFPGQIKFERFSLTVTLEDVPRIEEILRAIPSDRVAEMSAEVARIRHHFIWHAEPMIGDAFDLVLRGLTCETTMKMPYGDRSY